MRSKYLFLQVALLGAVLGPACKSPAKEAPKPAETATAVAPAPAPGTAPAAACQTREAVIAAHPAEAGAEPCQARDEGDLDGDGLSELTISCQLGMKSWAHTVYLQQPKGCFFKLAEVVGKSPLISEETSTQGFRDLSLPGEDGEDLSYVYDAATRSYQPRAGGAGSAGGTGSAATPAPTVQLPKAALRIKEITAISVGEPGLKGDKVECCLDCEPMVPHLRAMEKSAEDWASPMTAAALRLDATGVRGPAWAELVEVYEKKTGTRFVAALAAIADGLDATATALEAGDEGAGRKSATAVGAAVDKLRAAAKEMGAESKHYCGND